MKKVIALILAALLALSMVTAFAAEYTDKETVKKVQQALNDAGYDCGTPDGVAGKKTKNAIMEYQAWAGLEQTGTIDDTLLEQLSFLGSPTQEAAEGQAVNADTETLKKVQQALNSAGFDCGTPDGVMSESTKNAIMEFQAWAGLEQTGTIDDTLLEQLGQLQPSPHEVIAEQPVNATAEVTDAAGITFQGIPWGATPEEAQDVLVAKGFINPDSLTPSYSDGYTAYWPDNEKFWDMANGTNDGWAYDVGGQAYVIPLKLVGGYKFDDVYLHFIYGIDGDKVDMTPHLTLVILPFFDAVDPDALSDLLVQSYGKYEEHKEANGMATVRIWQGEENTGICLISSMANIGYLAYGKTDDYSKISVIQDAVHMNENAETAAMEDAGL